jgi:Lanthionine synthetase C-like protein
MAEATRHVALEPRIWDPAEAQTAIDEIVDDAYAQLDLARFWPAHPQDDGVQNGDTSLYIGAAGVIWALDHLTRTQATRPYRGLVTLRHSLVDAAQKQRAELGAYGSHASLHFGDFPALLVAMRLLPDAATADAIHARASDNNNLPVRELMWGLPGSMLACIFMDELTGDARWRALFVTQAARLLAELEDTDLGPLWTQDLYGSRKRYLGPVHGFAGNMIPLLRGWHWLDESQRARVADAVQRTLACNAVRSRLGVQWRPVAGTREPPHLCQHCHGAPGMVTTFADAPFDGPELAELLIAGGALVATGMPS